MQKIEKVVYKVQPLQVIKSEIDEYGIIETGGVLMGYAYNGVIFIEKASNGGPNAIHDDNYFRADPNYIDMFIDMEYSNSKGKNRYIGEWHTHPQVVPEPSPKDLNSLFEIAESSDDFCLLLIVGGLNFDTSTFLKQSISILKKKKEGKFYSLSSSIHE